MSELALLARRHAEELTVGDREPSQVIEARVHGDTRDRLGVMLIADEQLPRRIESTVSDWKVKGRGNAAEQLGLKQSTLRARMKRLGIARP